MKLRMKTRIAMVVVTLALTVVAGLAQAAETRFAVQDAAGTVDKMVVQDTGYVGIGTNTPTVAFHAIGTAANSQFRAHYNGAPNANGGGSFAIMHNNGSPTALPNAGDRIGQMSFGTEAIVPATGNPGPYYGAGLVVRADGPWQFDTINPNTFFAPSYISILTAGAASSQLERVKIASTGNVGIGYFGPAANPTQRLEVKGGVKINSTGAKPSCDVTVRGTFWVSQSVTTAADTVEVCTKDTGSAYSWKALY